MLISNLKYDKEAFDWKDVAFQNAAGQEDKALASRFTSRAQWDEAMKEATQNLFADIDPKTLNIDPKSIETVVISHNHWDHIGGLNKFLEVAKEDVKIYIPAKAFKNIQKEYPTANLVAVKNPVEIADGVWSTGEIKGRYNLLPIYEHALVLDTKEGFVVIIGCSHPGIDKIVKEVHKMFPDEPICLVTGGFHLGATTKYKIKKITDSLQKLNIKYIAPSHCTGDRATKIFQEKWKDNFLDLSLGRKFEIK